MNWIFPPEKKFNSHTHTHKRGLDQACVFSSFAVTVDYEISGEYFACVNPVARHGCTITWVCKSGYFMEIRALALSNNNNNTTRMRKTQQQQEMNITILKPKRWSFSPVFKPFTETWLEPKKEKQKRARERNEWYFIALHQFMCLFNSAGFFFHLLLLLRELWTQTKIWVKCWHFGALETIPKWIKWQTISF